jgi:predicted permease
MGWLRRLRSTFFSPRLQRHLDEELQFHIDERTAEYVRDGMTPEEARRKALGRFGGLALARDRAQDVDTFRRLGDLVHDVRYAVRTLRKNPTFAAAALLTLALGIGATSAVFSVVYGVLLRPLPYPAPERLVRVWEEHPGGATPAGNRWITNRTFHAWTDHPRTIEALGAYGASGSSIRIGEEDVRLVGAQVSPALLTSLGARPLIGRLLAAPDAEQGAPRVVLLSESFWRDHLASDPRAIGQVVKINGVPTTVIGVVPRDFRFPTAEARIWTPYTVARVSTDPAQADSTSSVIALARLSPGVSMAQAEAEGTAMARSVPVTMATRALFGNGGPPVVHVRPLVADMTGDVGPALMVLAAAVTCLLLIACANVANLVLTRGVARQREIAVRASIGAGRGRLARQLLTESFVLSAGGAALGLVLAWALLRITPAIAPTRFPRLDDVRLDLSVLAVAAAATLLATFLSGLLPAVRGARINVAASLRGGDGATAEGFRGARERRLRDGLLVVESAFAIMLLIAAALLVRSFVRLTHVDAGYTSEQVLTARVVMPPGSPRERTADYLDEVLPRLRATPGVARAGAGNMMPMFPLIAISTFPLPDPSGVAPQVIARAVTYTVTPGYAEALGLRLRSGRLFEPRDAASATRAMIVNEEFARQYLSGEPVVGRRFADLFPRADRGVITEIIGVMAPVLREGNDHAAESEIYLVAKGTGRQFFAPGVNIVLRTTGDPRSLAGDVRRVLRDTDRDVIIDRLEPLSDSLSISVAQPRFATAILVSFAVLALLLASVGLYGVLSYAVSQRRRELGVRTALGASRVAVLGLVLREGLTVAAIGVVLGLLGAAAVTRLMQGALFGVTPLDPVSFVIAPLVLLPIAIAACLLPAIRAARVGPAEALRE